ncbi:hypothetical protein K0U00_34445, partial [Paenibacillus sepulcri]|nr:hypothetical protein [Paenibacillus sepulcri]
MNNHTTNGLEIAVVGMACRVPGGNDIRSFWDTIKNGTEAISFFTNEELQEAGVDPETLRSPGYVKA